MDLPAKKLYTGLFVFLLFATSPSPLFSRIFLLTSDRGVLVSEDGAKSWRGFNRGLPGDVIPERMENDLEDNYFLTTRRSGIFRFNKKEDKWDDINSNSFKSPLPIQGREAYRRISALAIYPGNPDTIALATKHSVYVRRGSGARWKRITDSGFTGYITALSFGNNENEIFAGTSNRGIITISGGGFNCFSSGLPARPYSKGLSFYEEVSMIIINEAAMYAGLNFGGGVYHSRDHGKTWRDAGFNRDEKLFNNIYDMRLHKGSLYISSSNGIYKKGLTGTGWQAVDFNNLLKRIFSSNNGISCLILDESGKNPPLFCKNDNFYNEQKKLDSPASDKKAIYTNIYSIRKKISHHIDFIKKYGLNAIVIDMKDDSGILRYPSGNSTAVEIGTVKNIVDVKKTLRTLRQNGIYSIARVVVFKDKKLFEAFNNKYAIWNRIRNSPWRGNPGEYWVDPYSDFVRSYNVDIAVELQNAGFDEIQFDYIRFPSDGPLEQCLYRHKKNQDIYKSEILCEFLGEAKKRLEIPVSVDVYGFNAWYRYGNIIGQDVQAFAAIVDVICPMVYPSHFGRNFYMEGARDERSYRLIYDGIRRANIIVDKKAIIRPYLQAFNLLSPTWGPGYINNQLRGALKGGAGGYTFWNSRGDYKMLGRALKIYTGRK